ncbi:DEAD/DEAH box helicase family protein [Kineosporia babensis]|uniref:DEAD/DEAH box helicase family protein n=1 Tax=Kineosporia babensis TaxID=499548 RepID=A0A9X1N8L0_9ACTN|nr:DEAD/DEAH box helicase family protein [Kineosporia babensis]MCD5309533.1 DEAD/DEAH box helicase family protein [Kineosporia babensis]
MKLQFKVQHYQTQAVAAVADVFLGQPRSTGPRNAEIALSPLQLMANIHTVQAQRDLPLSRTFADSIGAPGVPNLDVEMETGTGKTYVYGKTILELSRRYGWSRFVVVVPSIAIREGVKRSFDLTAEHFQQEYGTRPRTFVYSSSPAGLREVERFASEAGVQVMIINLQAFNAPGRESRRIYDELDAFQGRRPIDVLRETRPIVIVDEPQKIGSSRSLESLSRFNPLMMLRYSATHRVEHVKVHRLDAVAAFRQKLVKKVAVRGLELSEDGRRIQIREVIKAHLEKERELFGQGVKVLSLFFIDEVAKYRDYGRPGVLGPYAEMFEQEYAALSAVVPADGEYADYLRRDSAAAVHGGYFSVDKKSRHWIDGDVYKTGDEAGQSKDLAAYDLILRDQERLLSLDEPVRFIFSHSALREGWDNPNVFVMGMLKQSGTRISRRQEIGRGLRLAVNQQGRRMDNPLTVHEINVLTVVTDESYTEFVEGLQKESDGDFPVPVDDRRARPRALEFGPEAQRLWNLINRKAVYRVSLATDRLVAAGIAALNRPLLMDPGPGGNYDLVGEISVRTGLTRRTTADLLEQVSDETFTQFRRNPEGFIAEAARRINEQKAVQTVGQLTYELRDERHEYRYVDPAPIDADAQIVVKLPRDYVIPTPAGDYRPDWVLGLADGSIRLVDSLTEDDARVQCARRWLPVLPVEADLWHR